MYSKMYRYDWFRAPSGAFKIVVQFLVCLLRTQKKKMINLVPVRLAFTLTLNLNAVKVD